MVMTYNHEDCAIFFIERQNFNRMGFLQTLYPFRSFSDRLIFGVFPIFQQNSSICKLRLLKLKPNYSTLCIKITEMLKRNICRQVD